MKNIQLAIDRNGDKIAETQNIDNYTECEINRLEEELKRHRMKQNEEQYTKNLRLEVSKIHKYAISYSEKSGHYTHYMGDDGKLKTLRKSNEKVFLESLAKIYNLSVVNTDSCMTLRKLYPIWRKYKINSVSSETMKRYDADWKTYYLEETLSQSIIDNPLNKLTKTALLDWAEAIITKHSIFKTKARNVFSPMRQLSKYILRKDILLKFPWENAYDSIDENLIKKYENERIYQYKQQDENNDTQIFTDEELNRIYQAVYDDMTKYQYKPTSAGLQILLMMQTGLRIGEACGLKYSDIDMMTEAVTVRRQANNERVKPPKANSYRTFPLSTEALDTVKRIIQYNQEQGYNADWLFQSDNEDYEYRLSYNASARKLEKLCKRLSIKPKSPHKLRKTLLTKVAENSNERVAQSIGGQKNIDVLEKHYLYDRSNIEQKRNILNQATNINNSVNQSNEQIDLKALIDNVLLTNKSLNSETLATMIVTILSQNKHLLNRTESYT